MNPSPQQISAGFYAAATCNIVGILTFTVFFTNTMITEVDPAVFSPIGLASIILWGLAYGSVARSYSLVPALIWVFAIEKLVYAVVWAIWITQHGHELGAIFAVSPITATFFSIYGAGDFVFCLFFAWVGLNCSVKKN